MTYRVLLILTALIMGGCANIPEPLQVAEGTQLVGLSTGCHAAGRLSRQDCSLGGRRCIG